MRHPRAWFIFFSLLLMMVACVQTPVFTPSGPVSLLLAPPKVLTLTQPNTTLTLNNPGNTKSNWKLTVRHQTGNPMNTDWFTLDTSSGVLNPGQTVTINLRLKDKLPGGLYRTRLNLRFQNKTQSYQVLGAIEAENFLVKVTEPTSILSATTPLSIPVTLQPNNGFQGEVRFFVSGLPSGITGTFNPNPATTQSTLELSTDGSAAPGKYSVSIQATSDAYASAASFSVLHATDNTTPGFSLSLEASTLALAAGQSLSTEVVIQRSGGLAVPVRLNLENVPAGLTATLETNPINDRTSLSFQASPDIPQGQYWVRLTGEAETLKSNSTLHLEVTPDRSASLSASIFTTTTQRSTASIGLEPAPTQTGQTYYAAGQLLVKYREIPSHDLTTQSQSRQLLSQSIRQDYGMRLLEAGLPGQHDLLETSQDVLVVAEQLRQDPRVEYAEPNYLLDALELPDDPRLSEQWSLDVAGVPVAWSSETGNSHAVTVAVIDTGFALDHPDLKGRFLPGYDFCKESKIFKVKNEAGNIENKLMCTGSTDKNPGFGTSNNTHGTHVAGLLAATGNNKEGITGTAYGEKVKLLPIKIFDDNGTAATVETFVRAIRWAVGLEVNGAPINPNPARIINLSLGGLFSSQAIQDAVNDAYTQGALVLAATGNDGRNTVRIPAASNHVLGVGSVEINFKRSSFSNYSDKKTFGPGVVDIMAPGGSSYGGLISTVPEGYSLLAGTSMATPIAAGIAALVLSQNPGLSVDELEKRLLSSVYFDTSFMNTTRYGKGLLRADLALGLPGPESTINIILSGPSLHVLSTTLDPDGQSDGFTIDNLEPGTYSLEILANGKSAQLVKTLKVELFNNQQTNLEITLP